MHYLINIFLIAFANVALAQSSFKTIHQPFQRTVSGVVSNLRTVFTPSKVVCYYNSKAHFREGNAKFEVSHFEPALQHCTHLIYGYAVINEETFKMMPLNEKFEVLQDHYRQVTDLKQRHPNLKVLLSVGGNADVSGEGAEKNLKYRTLLESMTHRLAFVNSAYTIVKGYGFDGLDLAWEFPENKPKKIRGTLGSFWHSVKKTFSGTTIIDEQAAEHKEQFTALVRELHNAFKLENLLVSLTVLPNVNSTVYYDPKGLGPHLDLVNLLALDFYTPERNPKEADYPAPLYELIDRRPDENVDFHVRYWLNGCPSNKIIIAIPTYGRAWKMDDESDINGMPPLHIDGAAEPGPLIKESGLLSYTEICLLFKGGPTAVKGSTSSSLPFKKVSDPSKRKGTYAFRLADENGEGGLWVGYDDVEVAEYKASYAKAKGIGGVALYDITLDDFRGSCGVDKFPLLKAARSQL